MLVTIIVAVICLFSDPSDVFHLLMKARNECKKKIERAELKNEEE